VLEMGLLHLILQLMVDGGSLLHLNIPEQSATKK